jgi:hypothetical protein
MEGGTHAAWPFAAVTTSRRSAQGGGPSLVSAGPSVIAPGVFPKVCLNATMKALTLE